MVSILLGNQPTNVRVVSYNQQAKFVRILTLGHKVKPANRQKTVILLKYLVIMIIWGIVLGMFVAGLRTISNSYPPPKLGE
jgi:hypothetical protein